MIADIAAVAATVLAVVSLVPQIVKLHRTQDAEGVSATWAAMGAVSNVGWFAYLVREALWAGAPAAVLVGGFYVVTVSYVRRAGGGLRIPMRVSVAWAVALALVLSLGGWTILGIALGGSVAIQVTPSVWSAFRTPAPRGVSPGTWVIVVIEAGLWGFYGAYHVDPGILTFSITTMLAGALILARYAATRHRRIRSGSQHEPAQGLGPREPVS